MEYVWIFILMLAYFATWACYDYILEWDRDLKNHGGVNFCRIWIYIHIVLFIIGVIGLFVYSLFLFIRK